MIPRFINYLNEMKVLKGANHSYWAVSRWTELAHAFEKLAHPHGNKYRRGSLRVLRGFVSGSKLIVWDGYSGMLHDSAIAELNPEAGHECAMYMDLDEDGLTIFPEYFNQSAVGLHAIKSSKVVHKVLDGCPHQVVFQVKDAG